MTTRILALLLAPTLAAAQAATPAPAARVVTLDQAVQSALAHQPTLREANASARAGVARADQARSGLLPQLAATAGVERVGIVHGADIGFVRQGNLVSGQLSLGQVLFDPSTFWTYRASSAAADALRSAEDTARLDAISAVEAAYFAARANRDLARVARETQSNDEAHLRQTEAFVAVGTQAPIALAQARAALASARLTLIQSENGYALSKTQLAQAMGLETWDEFEVGNDTLPAVPGEEGSLDPLVEEALAARPELTSLRAQERSTQSTRSAARSGYLPSLSARATYGEQGRSLDSTEGSWTAGLSLTWSLFDGGRTGALVRESEANLESLSAQDVALRTSIRVAVEQAYLGVRAARSSVQAAQEAETNAREQLRLAEGRYQAGAGSIIELGDAQVAASTAAAQRVQTEYNLSAARAALLRALGRSP